MQGKIWVMITFSRQSAERFSQNSVDRGREEGAVRPDILVLPPPTCTSNSHPLAVFWSPAPTFDLVGGCGPHLGLTVFHQVLEGRDQVCLGDLWPHGFLELQKGQEVRENERVWKALWANETKVKIKGTRIRGKSMTLSIAKI